MQAQKIRHTGLISGGAAWIQKLLTRLISFCYVFVAYSLFCSHDESIKTLRSALIVQAHLRDYTDGKNGRKSELCKKKEIHSKKIFHSLVPTVNAAFDVPTDPHSRSLNLNVVQDLNASVNMLMNGLWMLYSFPAIPFQIRIRISRRVFQSNH